AGELRKRGFVLHLGANFAPGTIDQKFAFCENLPLNEGFRGLVRSLCRIGRFDRNTMIIYSHSTSALVFAIALKILRCHRAIIIHTFHPYLLDAPLKRMSKALLYRFPQRLHCPSQNLAPYVSSYYKISRRCVVVVPLGADEKRFSPPTPAERTHYRERLGLA